MLIIELLNLVLVVFTSIKLGQQMFHRRVNGYFLAQCYLSSILLFTGLYALTFRLDHKSWRFVDEYNVVSPKPLIIVFVFLKMLYLSVSTATLCGSSVITPREWYNYSLMGLQMILSFVAFASILGQMFSHSNGPGYHSARRPPTTVRRRRPSMDSQASQLTAGSYGALDSTQPLVLNGDHNIGPS
ncbi:uncharacterized protein LOC135497027 [Lineus longissimus]|uniref:uncharacterized protein LOC135497027 n=1 Tax=Lineus longissimus TaxID=88925 RepID=UPI002B4DF539